MIISINCQERLTYIKGRKLMKRKVYQKLASTINARMNCKKSGNTLWYDRHLDTIEDIQKNHLPYGSGIDTGCIVNNEKFETLVIESSFHTMDEQGGYDRWIDFKVTVKPSLLSGIDLKIVGNFGKNQDLKDYLHEVFNMALTAEVSD